MAKQGGKKPRKSGKPQAGKSAKQEKKPAAPRKSSASKSIQPPKKAEILCQFCGKAMKDGRTRKLHERNCKAKQEAPSTRKGNLESDLLELKDRFDDERESILKTFQEKEDHLQRELEEVKTVLRMEIGRHRKELERISKVESEVAAKQDAPVQKPDPVPPASAMPEQSQAHMPPRSQPKAIDLIPMRIPHIPRMKVPQHIEPEDAIPDLDEDMDLPPAKAAPGLDRKAIEEIVREVVKQSPPESRAPEGSDNITGKINLLSGRLDHLDSKIERGISELRKQLERIGKEAELKKVEKDLEKVSEKVQDMMEDSGYGESLSVSKIPPTILEIVYQAILDDIHIEIVRTKGAQDAEKVARSALEEVRLKTSGSELFKFDGRKIVTDSLAKSIEANLISAKQIQTTYDVLMEKLLETVPHHKAKNFKGMIKVKSQEFAVDRATKLTKENARLEKVLESTNQMIAAMSANFNAHNLEIHDTLNQMKENTLASKANTEDLDALRFKLEESNERSVKLADEVALLKAQAEMKAGILAKEEEGPEEQFFLTPGEEPSFIPPILPVEVPSESGDEEADQCNAIYDAISKGMDSRARIIKETGLEETLVRQRLSEMAASKRIIEKKTGKRTVYTTLELELGRAKEETPPKEKKSGKKKGTPKTAEPDMTSPAEPASPESKPGTVVFDDSPLEEEEKAVATEPEMAKNPAATGEPAPSKPGTVVLDDSHDEVPEPSAPEEAPAEPDIIEEKKEGSDTKPSKRAKPKKKAKIPAPDAAQPAPKAPKKKSRKPAPEPEPKTTEPETPAAPEKAESDTSIEEEFSAIVKKMEELSEDEIKVLDAISENGVTLTGIQSKVGRHLKRVELLRALRVLIDSGHVGIIAKGRMELYQKINVQKIDKTNNGKNKQEVK